LPNWLFYIIFFAGLLGFLATYLIRFIPIPAIYIYKTPIQIVSVILIAIGVYMSGAISNEEAWQLRVKEMEVKVAAAQVESAQENNKIDNKIADNQQKIREKQVIVKQYIDREIVKYDTKFVPGGQCEIPEEFISILNKAATK
jgi:hypothetical protein